ncbi:hypothetical protein [Lysobacter sp. N42]|uniref:hypothetical protein n=1 Tax=Lysobacter sp. N42 TaxID=2545719 RepID=UPI0010430C3F|nr:hypothetical protein [Lysobacter sp. N42]TCZ86195.1 hypothetical protein EYQ95_18550 [Lysobacter sp. N42]
MSLFEPIEVMRLPADNPPAAVSEVEAFFRSARASLLATGRAPSKQRSGHVPDNPFGARGSDGRRELLAEPGWIRVDAPPPGFALIVKHNAAFTALLRWLQARFEAFAIVRNPAAVLASWHSVELPVAQGRVPAGEHFDPLLRARLEREPDCLRRQLIVLDWFFSAFSRHLDPSHVIRYEDVVATRGAALVDRTGLVPGALPALDNRNANPLYAHSQGRLAEALDALAASQGAWQAWYPREAVETACDRLREARPR